MSRMIGAASARIRLALALVVGTAVAAMVPSLALTIDAPSAAVLVAVALAVAAVCALGNHIATSVPGALPPRARTSDEPPATLAGRVTDPLHHPLRPRAPGLA